MIALFGRHVIQRALDDSHAYQMFSCRRMSVGRNIDSSGAYLDNCHNAVSVDYEVRWLNISVNDSLFMGMNASRSGLSDVV